METRDRVRAALNAEAMAELTKDTYAFQSDLVEQETPQDALMRGIFEGILAAREYLIEKI